MLRFFILLIFFSGGVNAITVEDLVSKYGKKEVNRIIAKKTGGELTIAINGSFQRAHSPAAKYINVQSISIDLNRIDLTPDQVDQTLSSEIKKKKDDIKKKEALKAKRIKQVKTAKTLMMARAKKELLMSKDKFDLEVEKAAREWENRPLPVKVKSRPAPVKVKSRPKPQTYYQHSRMVNPPCDISREQARSDVLAKLRTQYLDKYSLQETLLTGNMDAYRNLCSLPVNEVNSKILTKLTNRYYPSLSLIWTLYEGNIRSYRNLNKK